MERRRSGQHLTPVHEQHSHAMGGGRQAVLVSAFAANIGGAVFFTGSFMSYMSFDLLWWVAAAWCVLRLLENGNARWWLGVGAFIGMGFMTKYTMAFFAAALLGAMLLTPNRRYLRSPGSGAASRSRSSSSRPISGGSTSIIS